MRHTYYTHSFRGQFLPTLQVKNDGQYHYDRKQDGVRHVAFLLLATRFFGGPRDPPSYSVPVHKTINVPAEVASQNSSGLVNPASLIRPPRKHERFQEAPIDLPDHRILRKAQDRRDLFHRVPLLRLHGIQYEHGSTSRVDSSPFREFQRSPPIPSPMAM